MKKISMNPAQKKWMLALIVIYAGLACSNGNFKMMDQMSENAITDVSCGNVQNLMLDDVKRYLILEKKLPDLTLLQERLRFHSEKKLNKLKPAERKELEGLLNEWAQLLVKTLPKMAQTEDPTELLIQISAMDVGDQSDSVKKSLKIDKQQKINVLENKIQKFNLECPSSSGDSKQSPLDISEFEQRARLKNMDLSAFGAKWVMATAYQSCQALEKNPMDRATPVVQGIAIVGQHSDGVGSKRAIASLELVQKTHYYVNSAQSQSCFDVYKQPLIYDYGGKPYTDGNLNSELNLHRNAGDGTKVLGIDCSGFVFSAFATAGLRFQKNRTLKALDVYGWGSGSYVDPEANGLTCFSRITMNENDTIKAGDVVAKQGHVLMVDEVGMDPFGLSNVKDRAFCSSIRATEFDFSIIQSSNSKNGIGINRFKASDYFLPGEGMTAGIESYAVAACLAKFDKKNQTLKSREFSILRHSEAPECRDQRVALTDESCVQACVQL